MQLLGEGHVSKMAVYPDDPVRYELRLDDQFIPLNPHIGSPISIQYQGEIHCLHCQRRTKKSYSQGYCYPCFKKLAQCDLCVVSPDRCHYHKGTCREPEWGETFCMKGHLVYLANSSGIKVGITKPEQIPTRWIDQGALQGLLIARTSTRQLAGLVETIYKDHISDRTQWQKMLKAEESLIDLQAERDRLAEEVRSDIEALQAEHGIQAVQLVEDGEVTRLQYPVQQYPTKVVALNLDKQPTIEGQLLGIKGQYLILDNGVINLRKYTSYRIAFHAGEAEPESGVTGDLFG